MLRTFTRTLCSFIVLFGLAGCSGTGIGGAPLGPTPPPGSNHLYVADAFDSALLVFSLPISNTSTPTVFGVSPIYSVAADPGSNSFAVSAGGTAAIFTRPLTGSSSPYATLNQGTASSGYAFFGSGGKLYVSTQGPQVNVWAPPFASASAPTTISSATGPTSSLGLAFDGAGNLYVTNSDATHALDVFSPPYTSAPLVLTNAGTQLRDCLVIGQELFVSDVGDVSGGQVVVYNLPLTAASTPAFTMQNGAAEPEGLATDGAGNLYVANFGNGAIAVYTPPFTSAGAPAVYLPANGGSGDIFGITIGS